MMDKFYWKLPQIAVFEVMKALKYNFFHILELMSYVMLFYSQLLVRHNYKTSTQHYVNKINLKPLTGIWYKLFKNSTKYSFPYCSLLHFLEVIDLYDWPVIVSPVKVNYFLSVSQLRIQRVDHFFLFLPNRSLCVLGLVNVLRL